MKFFPKITFKKNTNQEFEEVEKNLNNLLLSGKYEGYWKNNILFIKKVVTQKRIITPDIKVELIENINDRILSVECELGKYFDYLIVGAFSFLTLFEFLIIRSFFIKNTIEIFFIFPLLMGLFIYSIIYFSYKWDADGFRYDLNKTLKQTSANLYVQQK